MKYRDTVGIYGKNGGRWGVPCLLLSLLLLLTGCTTGDGKEQAENQPEATAIILTGAEEKQAGSEAVDTPEPETVQELEVPADLTPAADDETEDLPYSEGPADPCWENLLEGCAGTEASFSLQGDLSGTGSTLTITLETDEAAYVTKLELSGEAAQAGAVVDYQDTIGAYLFDLSVHVGDVEAQDGYRELYVSGDAASGDYETYIYRVLEDGSVEKGFCYGEAIGVDARGCVLMRDNVYVLGTYPATASYRLEPIEVGLSLTRDGFWTVEQDYGELFCLTVKRDLAEVETYAYAGDAEEGAESLALQGTMTLPAGRKLWLIYTDAQSSAFLCDAQGVIWRLALQDSGLSDLWLVNGLNESMVFVSLPYAG